jgi:hypothetical protein
VEKVLHYVSNVKVAFACFFIFVYSFKDDGSYMSSTSNTIVIATNYRIGNLGFLFTGQTDANVGIEVCFPHMRFCFEWFCFDMKI